ncbi:hypothetical protein HHI36_007241 [Cryptolaemus montrouzieri]|uniref:Major facilitator superfamily (MFS) profile domain-containing protein n=1 Tax=Cryptolaemus montrouzieri TaxID=559131 RepID=A0ABD2MPG1_9CUCU
MCCFLQNILVFKMLEVFARTEIIQYLAVGFGSLNIITSGMQYGWPSASLTHLQNPNDTTVNVHLTASEGSWVAVANLIGAIIGSPLAGVTVDIVGRRKMILFTFFPYMASWLSIAFATTPTVMIFGRFISGISDGCIFTSLPIYIGEIASPKVRGLLCSSVPVCLIGGVLLVNVLDTFMTLSASALFSTIPPITCFVGMLFMPESPYFLLTQNRTSEARATLEKLRGTDDVDDELNRITESTKQSKEESKGTFRDVFTIPSNRRALLIMMLLRAAQQLSGITALVFYVSLILQAAGATYSVTISTMIFFSAQLIMSIVGSVIVDWTGRRFLLLLSALGSAMALFVEALYFQLDSEGADLSNWNLLPITALVVYVIFYGVGLQNIPILMLGELFPTSIKAAAVCFGDLYFAALAAIVSKFFKLLAKT